MSNMCIVHRLNGTDVKSVSSIPKDSTDRPSKTQNQQHEVIVIEIAVSANKPATEEDPAKHELQFLIPRRKNS